MRRFIIATNLVVPRISVLGINVGASPFSGDDLNAPNAIAFDSFGNAWLTNAGSSAVSKFDASGTALSDVSGFTSTGASSPVAIAISPK